MMLYSRAWQHPRIQTGAWGIPVLGPFLEFLLILGYQKFLSKVSPFLGINFSAKISIFQSWGQISANLPVLPHSWGQILKLHPIFGYKVRHHILTSPPPFLGAARPGALLPLHSFDIDIFAKHHISSKCFCQSAKTAFVCWFRPYWIAKSRREMSQLNIPFASRYLNQNITMPI